MLISKREWGGVCLYAALITLLTLIPYLVGWNQAGADWSFNGFTFGVDDGNAYLGKMRIGAEGDWNFRLFYTSEPHEEAFGLYLPYIFIGHLVRLTHPAPIELAERLAIAFQLWRILACFCLILVMYAFIAYFLKSRASRWLALLLTTLGGGLGWVLVLLSQDNFLGSLPVDFYIPEGFSFLVLYGLPHIATGRAMLLLGFLSLLIGLKHHDWRYALAAGLCWNVVGLMVTFYLPLIYILVSVWGMTLWLRERHFPLVYTLLSGLAVALTLPLLLYNLWLFSDNPALAQWSSQNLLPSPHPLHYVIGYGLLAVFAIWGGQWAWRKLIHQEKYGLLLSWVLCAPLLVYLPLNVQRRLAEAVFIPLVISAVAGLRLSTRHHHPFRRRRMLVLGLLLPSTLLLWLGTLFTLLTPNCTPDVCLYRSTAEQAAMGWLDDYAPPRAGVMTAMRTGNYLPIATDLRPFLGLGTETLASEDKKRWVKQFYRGEFTTAEQTDLLNHYGIRYIWFGVLERAIYPDPVVWNQNMTLIYAQEGYEIYEVKP